MNSSQTRLAAAALAGAMLAGGAWELASPGGVATAKAAEPGRSPTTVPAAAITRPVTIRQRFVPAKDADGTSFTALTPFDKDDVSRLFANVALGGSFPVDRDGATLFNVTLTEGDDDHLILEVREKDNKQKVDLRRDKSVTLTLGGKDYNMLYPSVTVDAGTAATTSTAFIVMTQKK